MKQFTITSTIFRGNYEAFTISNVEGLCTFKIKSATEFYF